MKETKADVLAENFEMRTGVDLRDYRKPEIVDLISNLLTFPLYAGKSVVVPLLIYLVLTIILAVLVTGFFSTVAAIIFVPVFSVLNALTTAALLFIFRLRSDITGAIGAGLSLTREVTQDVRNVQMKRESKTLSFPSFAETFQGVMRVVIVPAIITVIKNKVPLVGGIFSGLIRKLANLTTGRTIKKLASEHPELLDKNPSEDKKEAWLVKRLETVSNIADGANKIVSQSIKWASWILILPASILFGIILAITVFSYWLIF